MIGPLGQRLNFYVQRNKDWPGRIQNSVFFLEKFERASLVNDFLAKISKLFGAILNRGFSKYHGDMERPIISFGIGSG